MASNQPSLAPTDKKSTGLKFSRRGGRPPKDRLAFSARYPLKTADGPIPRLFKLTETELSEILALCRRGTDPMTATIKILGVTAQSFKNWRGEAETLDSDDRYKAFFEQVGQAFASCRSDCSIKVAESDPLAALTRGPLGRSQPGYPGWTETHEVRHTDHTGDGPPILRVRINVGRLGISSEVVKEPPRELPETTDDETD